MAQSGDEKLKLLIVDDEADNLDLLYRIFRQQFRVFRANSAFEALDILDAHGEMAIIISDQRMPKMKGTELLRRTVEPYPDTIRIVLTGYTDVEDLVDAINTGQVFKFITKPWKTPHLQSIVGQASDTYRAIKQRTIDLRSALRRESVLNSINSAIRESLDVGEMLHAIARTFGEVFAADMSALASLDSDTTTLPYIALSGLDDSVPQWVCYKRGEAASSELQKNTLQENTGSASATILRDTLAATIGPENAMVRQPIHLSDRSEHNNGAMPPQDTAYDQLIVPLNYQHTTLAHLVLLKQLPQQWSPEDIELIGLTTEQAALAISQAKLHQQLERQSKRMQAELNVARQIQTSLLRQQWIPPKNVRIHARCRPAQEVGGDFFEVYIHPKGQVWLAVGDVSGKGVPAALLMASAISVLRRELYQDHPSEPDVILQNLNSSLMDSLVGSNCFITMVLACYDVETKEFTYANAGHVYPMVWSKPNAQTVLSSPGHCPDPTYLKQRGVPLGILPHWSSMAGTLQLESGSCLLLASDGITEATVSKQFLSPSVKAAPLPPPRKNSPPPAESPSSSQLSSLTPLSGPLESFSEPKGEDNDGVMLRQSGLWQLIAQNQGSLEIDAILDTLRKGYSWQEDDQTILSMEIL